MQPNVVLYGLAKYETGLGILLQGSVHGEHFIVPYPSRCASSHPVTALPSSVTYQLRVCAPNQFFNCSCSTTQTDGR